LMVVLIIGVLMTITYSSYARYAEKIRVATAITDITIIKTKIETYRLYNNNAPPLTLADIGCDTMTDPWGSPYQYLNFSTVHGNGQKRKDHNLVPINSEYDLYSMGPDQQSVGPLTAAKSRDDIIMANDGAYIGPASDY